MFWRRKNKNKELLYQEFFEKETAIISYLTDGLLVFDADNKLSLINPRAEEFFKVRKEEILGKSILELNRYPNFIPLVALLGGGIRSFFREEVKIKENFILELSTVPMIVRGIEVGTLIILHDITREKLVEKMKNEFIALAAHQLRTPTSAIKWSLRTLLDGDLGKLTGGQKELIEKTYKVNDRAIKLINNLLDVAQIEEGKYLTKVTLFSIEEVIQLAVSRYKKEIKQKKLKFTFKKPEEKLPKVMLDIEKMKIAIGNILENAVRYTLPRGEISISLKEYEKEIEVQIKDTGVGIPKEQQEKVFSTFFRGANVIRMETEGTGLGLFISRNIIEAHGGRIWFESEEGKGTTFYFTIPIREEYAEFLTEEFY